MEMSPKARGPSNGAWIANNPSPKTCPKIARAVSHEAGDNREKSFN